MVSNYYKIVIPAKTKEGNKYKYKGVSYLLIEKSTGNIVLNLFLLDENQKVIGASNGGDGKGYTIKRKNELYSHRLKSFKKCSSTKPKQPVGMITPIAKLNELILKFKLTIKSVDAFISGSNSSGGLKRPDADPLRMITNSFIKDKFKDNLIRDFDEWKIFSLISNLEGQQRNSNFPDDLSIEYLNKIETKDFSYLFEINLKHIPYGEAGYEDLYVPFDEAFASQNSEKFINLAQANVGAVLQSENEFDKQDNISYIFQCIERGDKRFLSKQLRAIWRRIIDDDIRTNKFEKDFVRGISFYQRAHIVENHDATKFLLNEKIDSNDKKGYLENLFNKNNYILLTNDLHNYWDSGNIFIDEFGDIKNINLSEEEFKVVISTGNSILDIYNNTLTDDRIKLLEISGKH